VLSNLAPKYLTFRRAGLISATIAVLILPWNLYNSPLVIVYFLSGLGALLGPLYGVIMVDYWLVRKGQVNVPQLYSEDPNGAYYYSRGVNLRAVAAFIPAALIAIVLALMPGFHDVSPFSWLIGAAIAGMLYLIIAKRQPHYADVSGESIAVDNVSH
jgi:nucleobase:cation symporter-1, NCS1 family